MTDYKSFKMSFSSSRNPLGFLVPLIILTLFFTALFFIAKSIFIGLAYASPVLILLTLLIDWRVVSEYIQFIWKLLKENSVVGLVMILLSVLGFPIVFGFLFFKALGRRSIKKTIEQIEKEQKTYTDYEEVEDIDDETFLELPSKQGKPIIMTNQNENNDYDEVFK